MYYLELRKQMYNEGQIPLEDEQLRPLVLKIARFASKVEKNLVFSGAKENKSVKIHDLIERNDIKQQIKNLRVDKQGMPIQGGRGSSDQMKMMDNLVETVYFKAGWSNGGKGGDMIVIGDEEIQQEYNSTKKDNNKDAFDDLENEEIKEAFFDDEDASQFNQQSIEKQINEEINKDLRQSITVYDRKRNSKPNVSTSIDQRPNIMKRFQKGRGSMPALETTFNKLDNSIQKQKKTDFKNWEIQNQSTDHDGTFSQQIETNRAFLTIGVDNFTKSPQKEIIYPHMLNEDSEVNLIGDVMPGSKGSGRKMTLDDFTTIQGGEIQEISQAEFLAVPSQNNQQRFNALFNRSPLVSPRDSRKLDTSDNIDSQIMQGGIYESIASKNQQSTSSLLNVEGATKHQAASGRKLKMKMERQKRDKKKYFNEQMAKGKISGSRSKKPIDTQKTFVRQKNNKAIKEEGDNIDLEDFSNDEDDLSSRHSQDERMHHQKQKSKDEIIIDPQSRNALFEQHVRESDSISSDIVFDEVMKEKSEGMDQQLRSTLLNKMLEEVEQEYKN
ncbi:hypothetical protein FGO68_gene11549 [Halteria grandinella]|uniref:Uncharacterized protein n=1 Tax=Halteria grandinella TaxID=5974 RepID=A0A8J8P6M6_HALGN|nr:hypothetical protein FGO68_gene11549 [Halteria grandinella]